MTAKTIEDFDDANCRIEHVIHLASLMATSSDIDTVGDLCDWLDEDLIAKFRQQDARLGTALDGIDEEGGALPESLIGNLHNCGIHAGFFLYVSTPIPTFRDPHNSWNASYSWGYTRFSWVFGETFEQAEQRAIEYAREVWKEVREKAKAAKTPEAA